MSAEEGVRAIFVGAAIAVLYGSNWRSIVATALLICAFILTDWITEDGTKKRIDDLVKRLRTAGRRAA